MQFHEINNNQVMIFRLYTVHNKHGMIKFAIKPERKHKYSRNCSNNFAVNCNDRVGLGWVGLTPQTRDMLVGYC